MNKVLVISAIFLASLGLGFYVGTQYGSKTEVETVEREVVKRDVVTIVKEVVRKDGTVERETTTVDKSKEKKSLESTVTVSAPLPLNKLGISVQTENFREPHSYTLSYERRLVGPMWIGVNYNTKQVYGASISWEF